MPDCNFRNLEFSSENTFHCYAYRFGPKLSQIGSYYLCDDVIKMYQIHIPDHIPSGYVFQNVQALGRPPVRAETYFDMTGSLIITVC